MKISGYTFECEEIRDNVLVGTFGIEDFLHARGNVYLVIDGTDQLAYVSRAHDIGNNRIRCELTIRSEHESK